jgi:hypothetical protein
MIRQDNPIRTTADGAIDTGYYKHRGRVQRSRAFHGLTGVLGGFLRLALRRASDNRGAEGRVRKALG